MRRLAAALLIVLIGSGCAHRPLPDVVPVTHPATAPAPARFPMPRPPFPEPADDVFHAPPDAAELAATPPGTVMRYRRIDPRSFYAFDVDAAAWQLLYRSNDTHGAPQANVATVLVPADPRPRLLSYQVAYDALTRRCAPSREILSGQMVEQLMVNKALARHWIVVLPDYEGPEAAFMAGRNAAHGVLDAVRAARDFLPDDLVATDTPVAFWGYSGGAFASLWAAELAADYAPEIALTAVAAGGPPANLQSSAEHVDNGLFAGLYFAAVIGLSRAYDDIDTDSLLNAKGREMFADLGQSCVGQEMAWVKDPLLSGYTFDEIDHYLTVDDLFAVPAVRAVARDNRIGQRGFDAPLFYYQALFDQITPRKDARALARHYCDAGVPVAFEYALGDHITTALSHASNAADFIADRFAGKPAPSDCADFDNAKNRP